MSQVRPPPDIAAAGGRRGLLRPDSRRVTLASQGRRQGEAGPIGSVRPAGARPRLRPIPIDSFDPEAYL